jgi:hypothetical protein
MHSKKEVMKSLFTVFFLPVFVFFISGVSASVELDSLILQGIIDFDVPSGGSDGKAIHVYAVEDITDLSLYGIGTANNGGGSDGEEYTFPAQSMLAGQHLLLARSTVAMSSYLGACIGQFQEVIAASAAINQNGNDAIDYSMMAKWLKRMVR